MTNKEFAERLRKLAQVYEENPDAPQLYHLGECQHETVFAMDKAAAALAIKAFGPGDKSDDHDWLDYQPTAFPEIRVKVHKPGVCERVKVGERPVPETVVPARPAEAERLIPAHTEEVWEWQCGPLLAGGAK